MSVFRTEALGQLARFAEPALTGLAAIWLGRVAWTSAAEGNVFTILPLAGAGIAGGWCLVSLLRGLIAWRRGAEGAGGPGVVTVEEGRIGYFGPHGGGFVRIDELARIEVLIRAPRGEDATHQWHFFDVSGGMLLIPNAAEGAQLLPDALGALPGLSYQRLARTLLSRSPGVVSVWSR
ncbi:MAG: hypothetical protein AAF415_14855 [Pseudomonadota bacterium]